MNNIDISCVMSVYNESESMVMRAISSMLQQTYPIKEFVIVFDNPEKRDILAAVQRFILLHKEVEWNLIINEENRGLAASLNRGIRVAKYNYIARMDADDESLPNRLEESVKLIKEKRNHFVTTKVLRVDECGKPIDNSAEIQFNFPVSAQGNKCLGNYMCSVVHPTWLFSKLMWEVIGGYREELYIAQDYDFFLRALQAGYDVWTTKTIGLRYTFRNESVTGRLKTEQLFMGTYIPYYIINALPFDKDFVAAIKNGTNTEYEKFYTYYTRYKMTANWLKKSIIMLQGVYAAKFYRLFIRNVLYAKVLSNYYIYKESFCLR